MKFILTAATALAVLASMPAAAEPVHLEAVMAPKEQIRLDFEDGSKHFLLMVRREGVAEGGGIFEGASVVEYGAHDIVPGLGGDPRGYLVLTLPSGEIAYLKWQVRAVFVPGADGAPTLLDNGFWEVAGGTGRFAGMKGAGTLHIKAVSKTDRRFILDGDVVPAG